MEIKVFLDHRIGGVQRPLLPVEIRGDDGDEHIGIVPDFVSIDMVFVIPGMVLFVAIHFVLQFTLLGGIGALRGAHIVLRRRIGADDERFQHRLSQRCTGLQAAHEDQQHRAQQDDQQGGRMTLKNLRHPSRNVTRSANGLPRGSGAFSCIANGIAGSLHRGIFPADGTLLLPAGERIAGKLRILRAMFGLQIPDVGFIQRTFSILRLLIGAQLMCMISMFAHLQGGGTEPVALQHRAYRGVVIFIGLCKLLMQLIVCRFHRALNRMPETGGRFCFGFLKL